MAQVPYEPVPQVTPSSQGVHLGDAPAIPDAFGVNIAQAVEGFGSTLEKSGNELANRALQIQHDKNSADVDAADVQFMTQAGLEHAKYNALEGKARADAYPDYIKKLEEIRTNIGGTLTNVDARNMYNRQSRSTMGRTIFNGAGAMATAQRQYEKETNDALQGVATQQYSEDPTPENLKKIETAARKGAAMKTGAGLYDVVADEAAQTAISNAVLKRIQFVSRNDAPAGRDIMNKQGALLTADDKVRANNLVTTQVTQQGADLITDDVMKDGQETPTKPAMTLKEMEAEVEKRVQKYDPNNQFPNLKKSAIADIQRKYNQQRYANKQDENQAIQDITGVIMMNSPLSISEMNKDPKAYAIYSQMTPADQLKVQGIINSWHYTKDKAANSENFRVLRGMASDNVEKFMGIPPSEWKVNQGDWKTLYSIRDKILKGNGQYNDPRVSQAMTWLSDQYGQTLQASGVIGKSKTDDNVHLFRGTLAVALDQWQEDNPGKKINKKAVTEEIWPQLRGETKEKGMIFGDWWPTTTPRWQLPLPDDSKLRENLKNQIMEKMPAGSYEPTEEELRLEYMRQQWKTFSPKYKPTPE